MLTTEPGGGARSRRAECGCASPADGPTPRSRVCAPFPKAFSRERESLAEPAARGVRTPLTAPGAPTALRGCELSPGARLRLVRRSLRGAQVASHATEMWS